MWIMRIKMAMAVLALVAMAGCASDWRCQFVSSGSQDQVLHIFRDRGGEREIMKVFDPARQYLLTIYVQQQPGTKRVAFADKDKVELLLQPDSAYGQEVVTWVVRDDCYRELQSRFAVWPFLAN